MYNEIAGIFKINKTPKYSNTYFEKESEEEWKWSN